MQPQQWFERKLQEFRDDPEFQTELVLLDVTEQVVERMLARGMKRSELARKLGSSRAFVTRLLNGRPNLTLKTLVEVANALDLAVDVRLQPRYMQMKWQPVDLCTTGRKSPALAAPGRHGGRDESALAA